MRDGFDSARATAALAHPDMADVIHEAWLYELHARAADDTADLRGEQGVSDLLSHTSLATTKRPYLCRGKIETPTR